MDRHANEDGKGKYALVKLREIKPGTEANELLNRLAALGVVEWGLDGHPDEFFAIKLRDVNAAPALLAYAESAMGTDQEWAGAVLALSHKAESSAYKKIPD